MKNCPADEPHLQRQQKTSLQIRRGKTVIIHELTNICVMNANITKCFRMRTVGMMIVLSWRLLVRVSTQTKTHFYLCFSWLRSLTWSRPSSWFPTFIHSSSCGHSSHSLSLLYSPPSVSLREEELSTMFYLPVSPVLVLVLVRFSHLFLFFWAPVIPSRWFPALWARQLPFTCPRSLSIPSMFTE